MMDMGVIQRALGIIEGVAWALDPEDPKVDALVTAVEMIDGQLGEKNV